MLIKDLPPDHLRYLEPKRFEFRCFRGVFPPGELAALDKYGNWLEALTAGTISPVNAEQEHLLKVDREEAAPRTELEHAWMRLKARREFEDDGQAERVPVAPEDFGMVAWDFDRCWW